MSHGAARNRSAGARVRLTKQSLHRSQGGVVLTGGGGGGIGLGGTVGVSSLHSDAAEIYDIEGPFVVGGGDVSAGVGVQAETFIGAGHCGQIVGGGSGGVAVGAFVKMRGNSFRQLD